jgi:hypothetical protein
MLDDRFDPSPDPGPHGPSNGGSAGFSGRPDAAKAAPRVPGQRDPEPSLPSVGRPRLELSLTQILGSTSAAVTAAFLGSRLGVAGTLVGAALASVISVVGGAVYTTSIKATRHRVAQALVAVRSQAEEGRLESIPRSRPAPGRPLVRGVLVGASLSAVVFVAALTLITGYESVSGSALAGQAGGLTVLGGAPDGSRTSVPRVTPTSRTAEGSDGATASESATPTAATPEHTTGAVVGTAKPAARTNGTGGPTETPTSGETATPAPSATEPTTAPSTTDRVPATPQNSTPPTTPQTSAPATDGSPIATEPAPSG